jgi:hypothetical protein
MLDPASPAFVPIILGLVSLSFVIPAALVWTVPRYRLRRVQRLAAAGDPEAQATVRFLHDLVTAMNAGGPDDLQRRAELIASGRAGRAMIRAVNVGSTRVDRGGRTWRPVELTLEVAEDRRTVTATEYVDELYVARLLVGADVPVFVDRADPDVLTVGWDRA